VLGWARGCLVAGCVEEEAAVEGGAHCRRRCLLPLALGRSRRALCHRTLELMLTPRLSEEGIADVPVPAAVREQLAGC
jgi:hypothetical protein